jgi:hypothetical protein
MNRDGLPFAHDRFGNPVSAFTGHALVYVRDGSSRVHASHFLETTRRAACFRGLSRCGWAMLISRISADAAIAIKLGCEGSQIADFAEYLPCPLA